MCPSFLNLICYGLQEGIQCIQRITMQKSTFKIINKYICIILYL